MKQKTIRKLLGVLLTLVMVVGLVPGMGLTAYAVADIYGDKISIVDSDSGTLSSDMTCTRFDVSDSATLTINQGVTLTLNCQKFNFMDSSTIELHGTLTGSAGSRAKWRYRSYINVYLSDGAKYTVTGLSCQDGDSYLVYYGYDAATDGNGTVSVKNGSTDVTSASKGYKTTAYTFTATPNSGYKFKNWTKGAGGEVLGTDASINVTCEQNGQYQVYANFEADAVAVTESTYTITIPSTLSVANSGWNATGGISATGTLASGKKLTVTASSTNSWALKSGGNSVGYKLATASTDTAATTSWTFDSLSSTATKKDMGIIVEDYSSKPAGTYQDTVTFTASVEVAKSAAEKPDIAQADCTFSPSNGKSTLSNANITTSMEYSADNGTTWTDVTSAGSIASLAAGTVQIRVKETDEKLASEAVSITVPEVLHINELVGPYTGDRLTCEYYAGETWQALVDRYDLIKVYSGRAAFGSDGFIYYESGSMIPVSDLVDNTQTYEVQ